MHLDIDIPIRYIVAVIVLVTLPPAVLAWFAIHPFARVWRKIGPTGTYTVLAVPWAGLMVLLYLFRDPLLGRDFGLNPVLAGLGIVGFGLTWWLARQRKKLLTYGILSGIPELSRSGEPGTLLQTGIYARIRNPRYVEVFLGTLAYALVVNFAGLYVMTALLIPALYAVVLIEERELRDRFGEAYDEYCRRVPRLIPRRHPPAA